MNEIVNKFLLTGSKFKPRPDSRHPGFTCNACKPLTKHRERIQKVKGTSYL